MTNKRKIRVMVVDDSIVIRKLVTDALAADPVFELAGTASNGRLALAKLPSLRPDVVTLDIEMPELDGLETLAQLREQHPRLPVIMFSTLTARGAEATLDALARGASDYVAKPANVGSVIEGMQQIREVLLPKIKALCPWAPAVPTLATPNRVDQPAPPRRVPERPRRIDLVTIGVSTGGPNALAELLGELPSEFPVPIVVVQHMPPVFTRQLALRLDDRCRLPVREATSGDRLEPGSVWIAPGDYHLTVTREGTVERLETNQDPPENSCRPAVDVLFRSVANLYGPHALGVVLTGMGQDGLRGAEQLHRAGARLIAQDEATSVVWGMPGAVARAGLVELLASPRQLAREIVARTAVERTPLPLCSGANLP